MELRIFWPIGVHVRHVPLRSATAGDLAEIGMDTVDSEGRQCWRVIPNQVKQWCRKACVLLMHPTPVWRHYAMDKMHPDFSWIILDLNSYQSKFLYFVEVYTMITSNEYEDKLPTKRCDLHQSRSNLCCTISFFCSVFTLSF